MIAFDRNEQDRQELQRLRDELASIRDSLGDLVPGEIVALRDEGMSLGDENQGLRDQIRAAGRAVLRSENEHSEREQLGEQIRDLRAQLSNMEAQRDDLNDRIAPSRPGPGSCTGEE